MVINAELIESIDAVPDTKIILTTGNQFIVKEKVQEVIEKVQEYKRQVRSGSEDRDNRR